jgi:hypothetical protein
MADDNHGQTTDAENGSQDSQSLNDTSSTDNQAQFVTIEQLNRAMTGYNKRLEKQTQENIQTQLAPLLQQFEKFQAPQAESVDSQKPSTVDKEVLKLQKTLEDVQKKLQQAEQEKDNASRQAVDERVKSEVLSALTNLKVEKGDQVYRLIRDNIIIDESGKVKIRVVDPTLGFEDEKDLKSGLTDWLNSEGSHFLPPRNISGSGATNKSSGSGGQRITSLEDLNKMKPSDLAKVDLRQVLPEESLNAFFNTK